MTRLRLRRTPMTGRARAYLAINATRSLLLGGFAVLAPQLFNGPGFMLIRGVLPITVWGSVLLAAGGVSVVAAVVRNEPLARISLTTSAAFAAVWATGFLLAAVKGYPLSPTGILWGFALAGKDLVVCRQPMWSPFEIVAQQVLVEDRLADGTVRVR